MFFYKTNKQIIRLCSLDMFDVVFMTITCLSRLRVIYYIKGGRPKGDGGLIKYNVNKFRFDQKNSKNTSAKSCRQRIIQKDDYS